ncbi:2-alkenal reductase (NADP(+)-dependent)-like [Tripterygium wilfordii]|uniref:2-alkenal reductase (NADP(+)-dependent)-like n=1 Tax=Tripterygium wilfordii TaxID=458696 RepID=UPI0018F7F749|nr:2-alkenal reductase (NADP(+)-dependent)-like [Tripterygium wilfordii]
MEVINRYITIKNHIDGVPKESDFELKAAPLVLSVKPGSNDIIVKNLYVSIDPYQINRMKCQSSTQKHVDIAGAIIPGVAIEAYGVGKVVDSGNPEYEKGDLIVGFIEWAEYSVVKAGGTTWKLETIGFPVSHHVGILGINSGLAAYVGFFKICKPKKGERVFISAASGSVGNLVGQYAKSLGCYVVGSVGSGEKVALVKERLGFDDAFNYKEEADLKSALKRYFPEGIDIYFDNVGGEMQEAAVANMNPFGRVAACGVISEYTDAGRKAAPDMIDIVYKRIRVQDFLSIDHMNMYEQFLSRTCELLHSCKIQPLEDISDGIENIPFAFVGLFLGHNIGKKIVRIAESE